uniref:Uncharacterized protein n=1 Tax=Cacopsylla melanoneura TaxID=428564 RepID=A0A8D9EQP5_9HEMI
MCKGKGSTLTPCNIILVQAQPSHHAISYWSRPNPDPLHYHICPGPTLTPSTSHFLRKLRDNFRQSRASINEPPNETPQQLTQQPIKNQNTKHLNHENEILQRQFGMKLQ